jgi:hypothetical protein
VYKTPITLDINPLAEYKAVASAAGFLPNNRPIQPDFGRPLNEIDNQVDYLGGTMSNVNFKLLFTPG